MVFMYRNELYINLFQKDPLEKVFYNFNENNFKLRENM